MIYDAAVAPVPDTSSPNVAVYSHARANFINMIARDSCAVVPQINTRKLRRMKRSLHETAEEENAFAQVEVAEVAYLITAADSPRPYTPTYTAITPCALGT